MRSKVARPIIPFPDTAANSLELRSEVTHAKSNGRSESEGPNCRIQTCFPRSESAASYDMPGMKAREIARSEYFFRTGSATCDKHN